jgi:hypothetical protein
MSLLQINGGVSLPNRQRETTHDHADVTMTQDTREEARHQIPRVKGKEGI